MTIQNYRYYLKIFFLIYKMANIEDIKLMIEDMKNNSPSIFQRIPFNFSNMFFSNNIEKDDNDDLIEIEQQDNLNITDIENYNCTIDDTEFENFCIDACKVCKYNIFRFKIAVFFIRFWIAFTCSMISIVSEYKLNISIALSITFFGSFLLILELLADWNKLIEKYAHTFKDFYDLSLNKNINRITLFKNLVIKYNSNLLFIDIFEKLKLTNKNLIK